MYYAKTPLADRYNMKSYFPRLNICYLPSTYQEIREYEIASNVSCRLDSLIGEQIYRLYGGGGVSSRESSDLSPLSAAVPWVLTGLLRGLLVG